MANTATDAQSQTTPRMSNAHERSSSSRNPFLTDDELTTSMSSVRLGDAQRPGSSSSAIQPPPRRRTSSSYPEPTTIPTPGRALLRDGHILIMPATWESCPKCHGTGYKHADPQQPHEACWRSYGRRYTRQLVQDMEREAVILQKPLPSGSGIQAWSSAQTQYRPPNHAPPPLGPPQVNRTQDANEANEDPEGEAPPAYEDVVRVPQGVSLPPQRAGGGSAGGQSSSSSAPQHQPISSPPTPQQRPPIQHYNTGTGTGYPGQGSYSHPHPQNPQHFAQPPFAQPPFFMHNSHIPPPGALVVAPGDPRIGGRVCTRCGGRGVRDSMWWGQETCHHCQGAGRVL